ncbi:hypothetical protein [Roseivirga thermotolerans]|uniref:hypothetical protein n=1 Tax=Roseivirga thermotolerans TaxID=1758176 RepID=UPI00273EC032|nr:hypothetical protein [Roseivirga thermotolerans]
MSSLHLHRAPFDFLSSSQNALINPYLDPKKVKLDERRDTELMAFLSKLAEQFWYYDTNDQKQGDWSDFFKTDLTALLATISEHSKEDEYDRVLNFLNGIPYTVEKANQAEFLWLIFERVFKTALEVNQWYYVMTQFHVNHSFQTYLNQMIWQKLSFCFNRIYSLYFEAVRQEVIDDKEKIDDLFKKLQGLQAIWNFEPFPTTKDLSKYHSGKRGKAYFKALESSIKDFYNLYGSITQHARKAYYNSLKSGTVEPHIALISAFLKVYKHQQKALNKLVPKHLQFYYEDVLDFRKLGAQPDNTYLLFSLNKGQTPYGLKAKTQLAAGADSQGNPLVFETCKELLVVPSVIGQYLTMLSSGDEGAADGLAKTFYTSEVTGYGQPVIDKNTGKYEDFYMFGQPDQASVNTLPKAILGFALASPELWVEGGERQLKITFNLPTDGQTEPDKTMNSTTVDLSSLLDVSITGEKKWLQPSCYTAILTGNQLELTLGLDRGVASVSGYSTKTHGPGYNTSWPVLKAQLTQNGTSTSCTTQKANELNTQNAYQVLSSIDFTTFTIETSVKDLTNISLMAGAQSVPATATITPFGSVPAVGSRLLVGNYEAFIKHTQSMCINMSWVNLPSAKEFSEYYEAYNAYLKVNPPASGKFTFSLDAYTCDFSWLDQGQWQSGAADVELFGNSTCPISDQTTEGGDSKNSKEKKYLFCQIVHWLWGIIKRLNPKHKKPKVSTPETTSINYNVGLDNNLEPDYTLNSSLKYSDKSKSGFVGLTLTQPEQAFGNELYPKVVSAVTMQNTMSAAMKFTLGSSIKKFLTLAPILLLIAIILGLVGTVSIPKKTLSLFKKELTIEKGAITISSDSVTIAHQSIGVNGKAPTFPKSNRTVKTTVVLLVLVALVIVYKFFLSRKTFKSVPNKPYIPKAKDISLSYTASYTVTPGADSNHQFYRLHPYGIEQAQKQSKQTLIAQYPASGYVFLGFDSLIPNTTLTLFLGVEDRQDTTISDDFHSVGVEYLTSNGWLSTQVLTDSTYGLNKTGTITFQIADDAVKNNSIMPACCYWVRLSGTQLQVNQTKLTVMATNGVLASRRIEKDNRNQRLNTIAAGTIKSFIEPLQPIAKVVQPFASFGGEEPESASQFHQRVAQRIGHKERGNSVESIQSIVLDKFREIYGLNVVPGKFLPEVSADVITLTIVPWVDSALAKDLFKPVAPANMLTEVLQLLTDKMSDELNLEVKHAGFEPVKVSAQITFNQSDEYFGLARQLNNEFKYFLSPWIKGNSGAYSGKTLYVNDIIQWISNRPYVSSFDHLKIYLNGRELYSVDHASDTVNAQVIAASSPLNILISASSHHFYPPQEVAVAIPASHQPVQSPQTIMA